MKMVTHRQQQKHWDEEHRQPTVLHQIAVSSASSGVTKFAQWYEQQHGSLDGKHGLELCCGKGRNAIWLASQGAIMTGFDFSPAAVQEAKNRAAAANLNDKTHFVVQDATLPYPFAAGSFDFVIDCFGSTDIETPEGRQAALASTVRVLKSGGYLIVYLLSTDDEFNRVMVEQNPGPESGSFVHPVNGKFEKAFTPDELKRFYSQLTLRTLERVPKDVTFFGKRYHCNYIWGVWQKP